MPRHTYDDEDDNLLMALRSLEPCGNCGAEGAKIPCMSGCGEVFYCSRECNMHHASAHRLRCRNLRCSKFNDSESESESSDYEEYTDDSDEYETDDDEEEEEEEVKPKKGGKGKKGGMKKQRSGKGGKMRRADSGQDGVTDANGHAIAIDADIERRIEEKILRRLKKQEEHRITQAIEQRMREEKANWRDEEMNRIIMEMRERFQNEMISSGFLAAVAKKNGVALDGLVAGIVAGDGMSPEQAAAVASASKSEAENVANPQAEEKVPIDAAKTDDGEEMSEASAAAVAAAARARSVSKEAAWNNSCPAFEALRVVVWKQEQLPRMTFEESVSGLWNAIVETDPDDAFQHIEQGDMLISVNGRVIDENVKSQEDMDEVFAAFASPLILKFEARDPYNDKVRDYTVTWSNGPLGVTLKDDASSHKIPIVNRLTKKAGSVAVKQNIAIGDILVAINNIDTIQLGCSLSMSILKKVQLPAKLRFRGVGGPRMDSDEPNEEAHSPVAGEENSSSMSRPSTYVVTWGEGPLGLTIIPGLSDTDLPVIKKVTGTGTSPGIEKAQVGDLLETMNDIPTSSMPFEKVVAYLKSAPKPVVLKFRAVVEEERVSAVPIEMTVSREPVAAAKSVSRGSSSSIDFPRQQSSGSERGGSSSSARSSSRHGVAAPPAPSGIERPETYTVQWGAGPLGLTIDASPNGAGAYIKRIASQGAAASLSHDCVGDELTHINNTDASRLIFQDIVNLLKTVDRPVTLYFRRGTRQDLRSTTSSVGTHGRLTDTPVQGRKPSKEEVGIHYYNVVWQDGTPLGLSLRAADATSDYPYITRVTGAGSAAHLPNSVVGDCLISVDGRSVHCRDKGFDEVMTMLKSMPKPLTLKFQSRNESLGHRAASSSNLHAPKPQHGYSRSADYGTSAPFQSHSLPTPGDRLGGSALRQNSSFSRSFVSGSDRSHENSTTNEEKFSSIQAPFLVQNKLSTGRRQKMLKGLKK